MSEVFYQFEYEDKPYYIAQVGSIPDKWIPTSFCLESEARKRWWKPQPNEVVLDVGSHYGSYSIPALLSGASVIAVDPSADAMLVFWTNIVLNGFKQDKIQFVPFILGEKPGVCEDYYAASHSHAASGEPSRRLRTTLDLVALTYAPNGLDWVKIDAEGDEVKILLGAKEALTKYHPKVLLENHVGLVPGIDEQTRALMEEYGYTNEESIIRSGENENWSFWTA